MTSDYTDSFIKILIEAIIILITTGLFVIPNAIITITREKPVVNAGCLLFFSSIVSFQHSPWKVQKSNFPFQGVGVKGSKVRGFNVEIARNCKILK